MMLLVLKNRKQEGFVETKYINPEKGPYHAKIYHLTMRKATS